MAFKRRHHTKYVELLIFQKKTKQLTSFIQFKVEPVQIWSSSQLIKIFKDLGVNEKIGLTGRPNRPVGSLGTSKVIFICFFTYVKK